MAGPGGGCACGEAASPEAWRASQARVAWPPAIGLCAAAGAGAEALASVAAAAEAAEAAGAGCARAGQGAQASIQPVMSQCPRRRGAPCLPGAGSACIDEKEGAVMGSPCSQEVSTLQALRPAF